MPNAQLLTTGELLRRYRRSAGLTQEELAERAAVSPRSISDIERGVSLAPHLGTLDGLADALGLTLEERDLLRASARAGRALGTGELISPRGSDLPAQRDTNRRVVRSTWARRLVRHAILPARDAPASVRVARSLAVIGLAAGVALALKNVTSPSTSGFTARAFIPWQVTHDSPVRMADTSELQVLPQLTMGPSGNIFVSIGGADPHAAGVWKLAPSGKVIAHWSRYGRAAIYATDTAVDQRGNIFVLDARRDDVLRMSSTGKVVVSWGSHGSTPGKFAQAAAIAVDRHEHVFVADALGRIQKFTDTGKLLAVWANCGVHRQVNCQPVSIATDAQDNLFVSDLFSNILLKLSPMGRELHTWGGFGDAANQFVGWGPSGIAFDPRGDIFVGDVNGGRIHKFSPTGQPLSWWGATYQGLPCAAGLAIDGQSTVYVTTCQDRVIQKLSATGAPFRGWTPFWADPVPFHSPSGIAIDPQGHVLVVSSDAAAALSTVSAAGQLLRAWPASVLGPGQAHAPVGAAFDAEGNIYVVDAASNRVLKLSRSGKVIKSFGGEGSGSGQLKGPSAVAVDRTGNVYVSDTGNGGVVKFSPGGGSLGQWDTSPDGTALFLQPQGLSVDAHGDVYVADRGKHAIEKLSSDGKLLAQWGSSDQNTPFDPVGIAVDDRGLVYVTDAGGSRVMALSADGKMVAAWGRKGSRPGEFSQPRALTVGRDGTVYVADTGNNRIQRLASR